MNDRVRASSDVFRGAPWAASDSPAGLRSMGELRARIHALFCRIDQEMGEYTKSHDPERAHAADRTRRGPVVEWAQSSWAEESLGAEHRQ